MTNSTALTFPVARAVIVDLDGTMVDMVRLNRVANVSVARTLGKEACFVDALDIDSRQKSLKVGRWLVVDQE